MMTCINVTEFVLISSLEKDHSMIGTCLLKNLVIFIETITVVNYKKTSVFICGRKKLLRNSKLIHLRY